MRERRVILVATPEQAVGQDLVDRFLGQGYQAIAVERGSDALLAVAEENVGLVVLDISIQEPSGAKTVEIFRKMRPRLPVIALSGDSSVEMGRQILQHGVFYYLLKPIDLEVLDQIVRIALEPSKPLKAGSEQCVPGSGIGEEKGAVA
jgi:DNA-binding NtrC family response regulator